MDYKRLSESDSQGNTSSNAEDDYILRPKREVSVSIVTLIGLSLTTLLSVLTLLLLFLLRENRHCTGTVRDNGSTFSARFVQNTSRMSLDHEYDYLWDDWLTKGLGIISTSEMVGDKHDGSIGLSMYVFRYGRSLYYF